MRLSSEEACLGSVVRPPKRAAWYMPVNSWTGADRFSSGSEAANSNRGLRRGLANSAPRQQTKHFIVLQRRQVRRHRRRRGDAQMPERHQPLADRRAAATSRWRKATAKIPSDIGSAPRVLTNRDCQRSSAVGGREPCIASECLTAGVRVQSSETRCRFCASVN